MLCPKCGKEMKKGYLFASKDGAFSFAEKVPGAFENARNAEGFVQITELKAATGQAQRQTAAKIAEWWS